MNRDEREAALEDMTGIDRILDNLGRSRPSSSTTRHPTSKQKSPSGERHQEHHKYTKWWKAKVAVPKKITQPPYKHKPVVNQAMRNATSDPAYKTAAHKLFIENTPFSRLTPSEQRAFNKWGQAVGKPPLES